MNRNRLLGRVFGRWTVIAYDEEESLKRHRAYWLCRCECGTVKAVAGSNLLSTTCVTTSCGCARREAMTRHGLARTPEFASWSAMMARCYDTRHMAYKNYGGRGITVCERWRNSPQAFVADMGLRPDRNYTLDRIDNSRGYEPDNCRWATRIEQRSNTRINRILTVDGQSFTMSEWGRRTGLGHAVIGMRLRAGWSHEHAVTVPLRGRRPPESKDV